MGTPGTLQGKVITLGVTGSIAAYKSAEIVRELVRREAEVHVLMTANAHHFITDLTLSALSGHAVHTDMWSPDVPWEIDHLNIANRADAFVIAPASADFIARVAHGFANDLLTATLMATRKPVVIAPAMNSNMVTNPIVQQNVQILKDQLGYRFCGPVEGQLASGKEGIGRMEDPAKIVDFVEEAI